MTDKTVKTLLEYYYTNHVAVKVEDRRRAEYAIDSINRHLADLYIHDVDIPKSREYCAKRLKEGVGNSTVRRELGVLTAAANHCLRWRIIEAKDMPSIELPETVPARTLWLYKDELKHFMKHAEGRVQWFTLLAYYTAARKRSLETLTVQQVDLEMWRINLSKPGEKKTKKRRPIVPIATEIRERLATHIASLDNDYVLYNNNDISTQFSNTAEKAGMLYLPARGLREEGRFSPHVLRHTRATHLLQDGKNPFAVANLLGDDLRTVLKVYGHACPDYLEEVL